MALPDPNMSLAKSSRQLHRWGALLIAAPLLLVVVTGLLLQLKKQVAWIQPPTLRAAQPELGLGFDQILAAAASVPEAEIVGWESVDRLDVRPERGLVKVRARNRWEVQLDARTGEVLLVAYRRSDLIESLHDGSFFHEGAKLWLFLPVGAVLLGLWITGLYLFFLPAIARRRRRRKARTA